MADLIIEVPGRPLHQYHPLGPEPVRVGRALDNDLILSDPTVSAHHMLLRALPGGDVEIRNLSDENGTRIGRRLLREPAVEKAPPVEIEAGRVKLRIVDRRQAPTPTRLISCNGGRFCLYHSVAWLFATLALAFGLLGSELYLDSYKETLATEIVQTITTGTFAFFTVAFVFAVINRLALNRWDFPSTLVLTALLIAVSVVSDHLSNELNYFFTSDIPGEAVSMLNLLVVLPLLLYHYYVVIHHAGKGSTLLIILLLTVPAIYIQGKSTLETHGVGGKFSPHAQYNRTLSPFDTRLMQTVSVKQFLQDAKETLQK